MHKRYSDKLTPREQAVYDKIVNNIKGLTQEELADELCISKHTFHTHLLNIYLKTGTKSQTELIIKHYQRREHNGNCIS